MNKDGKLTRGVRHYKEKNKSKFDFVSIVHFSLLSQELMQFVAALFQLIVPISKCNYASITSAVEQRTDEIFQVNKIERFFSATIDLD